MKKIFPSCCSKAGALSHQEENIVQLPYFGYNFSAGMH